MCHGLYHYRQVPPVKRRWGPSSSATTLGTVSLSVKFSMITDGKNLKFPLYPLLLPQIVSDSFQNVPFCSVKRGLQGHTLLTASTSTPPQSYLTSSHPLPSLLQFKICGKIVFYWSQVCRGNGKQKLNLSNFRESIMSWMRKSTKSTSTPGTNFLYRTKPHLVLFLYR
jgi:hypothetical protein